MIGELPSVNETMKPAMANANIELETIVVVTVRDPLDVQEARPTINFEVRVPAMVFRAWIGQFTDHRLGSQRVTDILDHWFGRHVLPLLPIFAREYRFRGAFNVVIVWQIARPVKFTKDCRHTFAGC